MPDLAPESMESGGPSSYSQSYSQSGSFDSFSGSSYDSMEEDNNFAPQSSLKETLDRQKAKPPPAPTPAPAPAPTGFFGFIQGALNNLVPGTAATKVEEQVASNVGASHSLDDSNISYQDSYSSSDDDDEGLSLQDSTVVTEKNGNSQHQDSPMDSGRKTPETKLDLETQRMNMFQTAPTVEDEDIDDRYAPAPVEGKAPKIRERKIDLDSVSIDSRPASTLESKLGITNSASIDLDATLDEAVENLRSLDSEVDMNSIEEDDDTSNSEIDPQATLDTDVDLDTTVDTVDTLETRDNLSSTNHSDDSTIEAENATKSNDTITGDNLSSNKVDVIRARSASLSKDGVSTSRPGSAGSAGCQSPSIHADGVSSRPASAASATSRGSRRSIRSSLSTSSASVSVKVNEAGQNEQPEIEVAINPEAESTQNYENFESDDTREALNNPTSDTAGLGLMSEDSGLVFSMSSTDTTDSIEKLRTVSVEEETHSEHAVENAANVREMEAGDTNPSHTIDVDAILQEEDDDEDFDFGLKAEMSAGSINDQSRAGGSKDETTMNLSQDEAKLNLSRDESSVKSERDALIEVLKAKSKDRALPQAEKTKNDESDVLEQIDLDASVTISVDIQDSIDLQLENQFVSEEEEDEEDDIDVEIEREMETFNDSLDEEGGSGIGEVKETGSTHNDDIIEETNDTEGRVATSKDEDHDEALNVESAGINEDQDEKDLVKNNADRIDWELKASAMEAEKAAMAAANAKLAIERIAQQAEEEAQARTKALLEAQKQRAEEEQQALKLQMEQAERTRLEKEAEALKLAQEEELNIQAQKEALTKKAEEEAEALLAKAKEAEEKLSEKQKTLSVVANEKVEQLFDNFELFDQTYADDVKGYVMIDDELNRHRSTVISRSTTSAWWTNPDSLRSQKAPSEEDLALLRKGEWFYKQLLQAEAVLESRNTDPMKKEKDESSKKSAVEMKIWWDPRGRTKKAPMKFNSARTRRWFFDAHEQENDIDITTLAVEDEVESGFFESQKRKVTNISGRNWLVESDKEEIEKEAEKVVVEEQKVDKENNVQPNRTIEADAVTTGSQGIISVDTAIDELKSGIVGTIRNLDVGRTASENSVSFKNPAPAVEIREPEHNGDEILKKHTKRRKAADFLQLDPTPQISDLIEGLKSESASRRSNACGTLKLMSSQKKNTTMLGKTSGLIEALLSVSRTVPDKEVGDKDGILTTRNRALTTIALLCQSKENRRGLCENKDLISHLFDTIKNGDGEPRLHSCSSIAALAKTEENRDILAEQEGLIEELAAILTCLKEKPKEAVEGNTEGEQRSNPTASEKIAASTRLNACAALLHLSKQCAVSVSYWFLYFLSRRFCFLTKIHCTFPGQIMQ